MIVSASMALPPDLPILRAEGAPVIVATGAEGELEGVAAD